MSDPATWTTTAQVVVAVRRRWADGALLRALAEGGPCPRIDVPLRGPSAVDLGDHFDAAVTWSAALRRGARDGKAFDLVVARTGGRATGRSDVPSRAVITRFDQAWRLLGVEPEVAAFQRVMALCAGEPEAHAWALAHPVAAAALAGEWPALLAARRWLDQHRGSGDHLRQVTAEGVDTKFVERHRGVLASWLGVPASSAGFLAGLGLARKPAMVRLRADPALGVLAPGLSEAVLRAAELGSIDIRPALVLVVENEVTYLTVPVPVGGLVLWGRGYDVEPLRALPWLAEAQIVYWGDLDTHGFAILDRLRRFLPQTSTVLMDRETLLAHRPRWGREPDPIQHALPHLADAEQEVYAELVTDALGKSVRLEQEHIDWSWVMERLPAPAISHVRAVPLVEMVIEDLSGADVEVIERRARAAGQTPEGFVRRRLLEEAERGD